MSRDNPFGNDPEPNPFKVDRFRRWRSAAHVAALAAELPPLPRPPPTTCNDCGVVITSASTTGRCAPCAFARLPVRVRRAIMGNRRR